MVPFYQPFGTAKLLQLKCILRKWTKKHARFIGRIIFANFLEIPLERYKNIIEEVEGSTLFKKLLAFGINRGNKKSAIIIKYLSEINTAIEKTDKSSTAVAVIVKGKNSFGIKYIYKGFSKIYIACRNLHLISDNLSFFHKLRRISSRNELTHRIIEGIIDHQKKFLGTGDPLDLAPVTQIQLVKWLNREQSFKIDTSWVSRIVNRISVIIPSGEERALKSFFPTRKNINKRRIKKLLDKEDEDIESGRLKNPLTDNQIMAELKKEYDISLSRWAVGLCRKEMGIPPSKRRLSGYKYPPLSANFSLLYHLMSESVQNNAPACSGIYELRLKGEEIEHPKGKTNVIYIGSAKNIRKRLKEHLRANNKNGRLRDFLKNFDCSFRYISCQAGGRIGVTANRRISSTGSRGAFPAPIKKNNDTVSRPKRREARVNQRAVWREKERELYELFVATFGSAPKCNKVRP